MAEAQQNICTCCGAALDPLQPGNRLTGKTRGEWQCSKCSSVDTRLRRLFGTCKIPGVDDFTSDELREFYVSAQDSKGKKGLRLVVRRELKTRLVKRNTNRTRGEWLPLSVWESRGWKKEIVENHLSCVDEQKGLLYNVDVQQSFDDDINEQINEMLRSLSRKPKTVKPDQSLLAFNVRPKPGAASGSAAANAGANADAGGGDDVADDDSESSDSSSSTDGKQGPKQKKASKTKKKAAKEKEEARKEKSAEKAQAAMKKEKRKKDMAELKAQASTEKKEAAAAKQAADKAAKEKKVANARISNQATKIICKVAPIRLQLAARVADPEFQSESVVDQTRVTSAKAMVDAIYDDAQSKVSSKDAIELEHAAEAVNRVAKEAASALKT